ncbi:MAG: tRNA dihydrouridine synthase DusB [Micromonosporaceae bacterium]|nr:tRNA dihydrouridine synthase DusB [Micromonosporaceae bacterium]
MLDGVSVTSPAVRPPGASPLPLGEHQVWPPVVLAPMAGITNVAFRRLCREHGEARGASSRAPQSRARSAECRGLYICEMVTTRALVERNPKTLRMVAFEADEKPRSLQLYGVDPAITVRAVRMVVEDNLADHVDLNFGCPAPKVTRKGGGAALPWRRRLFEGIVRGAVDAAAPAGVPVTVKMRLGIDAGHLTYLEAGRIAEDAGAAWVALHARTAADRYSGRADWEAIARLKAALTVPVLGNGDIWEASDALDLMRQTGCDGVVVGRGCLGRPWLFADLATNFADVATSGGRGGRALPTLGEVARTMRRHAELLVEQFGDERDGCVDFRKHVAWYLKGFPVGSELRRALAMIDSLAELDDLLGKLDVDEPYPAHVLGQPRGRVNAPGKVFLPDGWLDNRDDETAPAGAEFDNSGG